MLIDLDKRYVYYGNYNNLNSRYWLIWLLAIPVIILIIFFLLKKRRKTRILAGNNQYYNGGKPNHGLFGLFGGNHQNQPQYQQQYPQSQYQQYPQLQYQQYQQPQQSYQQQYGGNTSEYYSNSYGDAPPMYPADEVPAGSNSYSRPEGPPPADAGASTYSRPENPPPAHTK